MSNTTEPVKICVECGRSGKTAPTRYVCAAEHRQVVHRKHISLYVRCGVEGCNKKIIGVEKMEGIGPADRNARAYYKRLHTCSEKEDVMGNKDYPTVKSRLEDLKLVNCTVKSNGWTIFTPRPGVTQQQIDDASKTIQKELNLRWKEVKKNIDKWFAEQD